MKNILILGGNRFVGLQLANSLKNNYQITIFNRKGTGPKNVNIIQGDRNNIHDINKIDFESFDIIFDFCLFKPEQFELIKNKIKNSTKYIFISSGAIYSKGFGLYGEEKKSCETLIINNLNNYLILRPPYIDGPGSHRPRLAFYLNKILLNQPIPYNGDGSALFNIIWIEDLVNLLIDLVNSNFINLTKNEYDLVGEDIFNIKSLVKLFYSDSILIQSDEEVPYINENLILTSNELSHYFKPISTKLEYFKNWYNNNSNTFYGYKTII